MAATRRLSPNANLLRNSRLFSLPPPLPRPNFEAAGATVLRGSDTATLPFPTHQAIETTQSSLYRGDWGLKRPLPAKGIKATTTPTIRIGEIDSIDHITDFGLANDHAITLRKWQEMNISISDVRRASTSRFGNGSEKVGSSVFESSLQSTEKHPDNSKRWKFDGPWVAGQSRGKFEDYLTKQVRKRRPAFNQFLRTHLAQKKNAQAQRKAIDRGDEVESTLLEISEEDYDAELARLRSDPEATELWTLMWEFLDLPGTPPDDNVHVADHMMDKGMGGSFDEDGGPPNTHPSAGLSYLRTTAHVPNHPILGPVNAPRPIEGRPLQKSSSSSNSGWKQGYMLVGVGGIVAGEDRNRPFHTSMTKMDPHKVGGTKIWAHPTDAKIDSRGRIKLTVGMADRNTSAIWEGDVDPTTMESNKRAEEQRNLPNTVPNLSFSMRPKLSQRGVIHGAGVPLEHTREALSDLLKVE